MKNRIYKMTPSMATGVPETIAILRNAGWKKPRVYSAGTAVFVLVSRKVKDGKDDSANSVTGGNGR